MHLFMMVNLRLVSSLRCVLSGRSCQGLSGRNPRGCLRHWALGTSMASSLATV